MVKVNETRLLQRYATLCSCRYHSSLSAMHSPPSLTQPDGVDSRKSLILATDTCDNCCIHSSRHKTYGRKAGKLKTVRKNNMRPETKVAHASSMQASTDIAHSLHHYSRSTSYSICYLRGSSHIKIAPKTLQEPAVLAKHKHNLA